VGLAGRAVHHRPRIGRRDRLGRVIRNVARRHEPKVATAEHVRWFEHERRPVLVSCGAGPRGAGDWESVTARQDPTGRPARVLLAARRKLLALPTQDLRLTEDLVSLLARGAARRRPQVASRQTHEAGDVSLYANARAWEFRFARRARSGSRAIAARYSTKGHSSSRAVLALLFRELRVADAGQMRATAADRETLGGGSDGSVSVDAQVLKRITASVAEPAKRSERTRSPALSNDVANDPRCLATRTTQDRNSSSPLSATGSSSGRLMSRATKLALSMARRSRTSRVRAGAVRPLGRGWCIESDTRPATARS